MAFFDKLNQVAKNIGDKTTDAIETTKLNNKSNAERTAAGEDFKKIGEYYYNVYVNGGSVAPEVLEACQSAKAHLDAAAAAQAEVERIKAENEAAKAAQAQAAAAPAYQSAPAQGMAYQSAPAQGMAYQTPPAPPVQETPPAAPAGTFCTGCGAQLPPGARFCGTCGTKLG